MTESAQSIESYRPEIDGLRGVAVLLVLFFHAEVGPRGGFLGVDIFFVISGFLITSLMLARIDRGTFSFSDFWLRRIRRIFPAMFVVTMASLVAGYALLFSSDFCGVARSALAQQFFSANIYFWRTTDYFAPSGETLPLLHYWSLAIEEQFYLIFPFFVYFSRRRLSTRSLAFAVVALILGSLAISEVGQRLRPVAAFYLLPSRAWELLSGAILAMTPRCTAQRWANVAVWTGAFLISASVVCLTPSSPFPGLSACPTVLGSALLIWGASAGQNSVSWALRSKSLRGVGAISYSLYLWHWPLFAYTRYWFPQAFEGSTAIVLLGVALVLGTISWFLFEQPFRRRRLFSSDRTLLLFAGSTTAFFILASTFVLYTGGIPTRLPKQVQIYEKAQSRSDDCLEVALEAVQKDRVPEFGDEAGSKRVLLWGDSHAMVLKSGLSIACEQQSCKVYQITCSITAPIFDFVYMKSSSGLRDKAPAYCSSVRDFMIRNHIDIVVLAGMWSEYANVPTFEERLRATLLQLQSDGIYVVLCKDVASGDSLSPRFLARKHFWGESASAIGVTIEQHRSRNSVCDHAIKRAAAGNSHVIILDPAEVFTDSSGKWKSELAGEPLYFDTNHLSPSGSKLMAAPFRRVLSECMIRLLDP